MSQGSTVMTEGQGKVSHEGQFLGRSKKERVSWVDLREVSEGSPSSSCLINPAHKLREWRRINPGLNTVFLIFF